MITTKSVDNRMKSGVEAADRLDYDVIVIGAGALGCAVARELSRYDLRIAVLEKNSDVAGETTGRNSAVVHAGFNNRPGSLMARFCVEGNQEFEALCRDLDVPYRKTGKLVLAFDPEDIQTLKGLLAQGRQNGCRDLEILEGDALDAVLREYGMEGVLECGGGSAAEHEEKRVRAALYSPHSAITNPFLYCVALAENAQMNGADFKLDTEVTGIRRPEGTEHCFEVRTMTAVPGSEVQTTMAVPGPEMREKESLRCRYLINCAGLQADRVAVMAGMAPDTYRLYPCRGEYYILDKADLPMPVYPAPKKKDGGLGVHLTPTIEGNILIGPSAVYLDEGDDSDRDDYACTRPVMKELMRQARELMPGISGMQPIGNYAGIRPKQAPPGEGGYYDFVVRQEETVPGLIDLIGIESPGLTASVPIAREVCRLIKETEGSLPKEADFCETRRGILRFREQTLEKQKELIRQDPDYGEIICRCQKITRREIRDAIENPLGARSISAIKYRAWATTGRCNGGYCMPRIVQILLEEYGMKPEEIQYRDQGSGMFTGRVK